mgnify:CR=1 FL=1
MEQVLSNAYVYWIITGIVGAITAALIWMVKRQREKDDERFKAIENRQDGDHERLEKTLRELPLTYTLREEFLRVTTQQSSKLDRITDIVSEVARDVAALAAGKDDKK